MMLTEVVMTLKLVYKNMVWDRPKYALCGLIFLAMLLTTNLYFSLERLGGNMIAIPVVILALACWFFMLPCVLTLIDLRMNPQRMGKLWATIAKR
jgi:hypothetical protein